MIFSPPIFLIFDFLHSLRSWWIIQTQPTREGTGRPSNPTNRSWWIRSYPAYDHSGLAEISSNGRFFVRLGNHPPTARSVGFNVR
jgi:hypothetical protein